jgi:hypothetical protein
VTGVSSPENKPPPSCPVGESAEVPVTMGLLHPMTIAKAPTNARAKVTAKIVSFFFILISFHSSFGARV